MPSLTIENYVKTIFLVCEGQEGRPAATGQLASALGVLPGTVTSMLKTLDDSGLARYTPYEGVALTDAGRALALRMVRRHRLIELFLVKTLRLNWDEVHEEAENMEHAVSDRLIDRLDAFLNHPDTDPHGDPIPKADGTLASPAGERLRAWPPGQPFRLAYVEDQSPGFLRQLSEQGLSLDSEGVISEGGADDQPMQITIAGRAITLDWESAGKIRVVPGGD